jgi:PXA domain
MITDFLLLLVGPNEEVGCRPVQLLSSQIISSVVFLPLLNLLSDPDYINQVIIWLVCLESTILLYLFFIVDSNLHFCSAKGFPQQARLFSQFYGILKMPENWSRHAKC